MLEESLDALVQRARGGDRSAFDELFETHADRLRMWIRSRLGEKLRRNLDVDDVLQETQLRAFRTIDRFKCVQEDSFHRWLATIAQHLIWSASQKRSTDDIRLVADPAVSDVSPSRRMRREDRFDRLDDALQRLRPDEREAVRLARIKGLKVKEVAQRMKRPEATVKSLISRSLRKLRESFGETESFHLPDRFLSSDETRDDAGRNDDRE